MSVRRLVSVLMIILIGIICEFAIGLTRCAEAHQSGNYERPKWKFLRHQEDWSALKGVPKSEREDFWDGIKYVQLGEGSYASFGGHTRFRVENWSSFNFGSSAQSDDTFLLWRATLHGDVHLGRNIRVFLEGKSALSEGRNLAGGRRTIDVDSIALQQAFIDLKFKLGDNTTVILRPGRQELLFGKQRLVSPLPWGNTLRHWDGVTGIFQSDSWTINGFWTEFTPVRKYEFNESDSGSKLFGIYSTGKLNLLDAEVDFYWLGIDRDNITFNGTTGNEDRHTVGVRIGGKVLQDRLDYDLEGAYQFGEIGSGDINAYMIASQFGYKQNDLVWNPRLYIGFDYASGDDAAAGDVETFNQLFPLGHAYLGFIDIIGRQNIVDFSQGISFKPIDKLTIDMRNHLFWRAKASDALYKAGGGVARTAASGSSKEVGDEFDLTAKYKFDRHCTGVFGYSHFFAGDFIEESGTSNDTDFVYAIYQYTF